MQSILADTMFFPPERSTVAGSVDGLFDFIYYLSAFFFVLIVGADRRETTNVTTTYRQANLTHAAEDDTEVGATEGTGMNEDLTLGERQDGRSSVSRDKRRKYPWTGQEGPIS